MSTVLIILAFLCLAIGIAGAVIPGLPGPPVSWVGLLLAALTPYVSTSATMLIVTAVIAAVITVLDYVVPSLSTKRLARLSTTGLQRRLRAVSEIMLTPSVEWLRCLLPVL